MKLALAARVSIPVRLVGSWRAEVANHNPLPPYEDYAHVKRRTKYTYNPVDMSALKNSEDPTAFQEHAGVEYEQGWLKQDVAPDAKFGDYRTSAKTEG